MNSLYHRSSDKNTDYYVISLLDDGLLIVDYKLTDGSWVLDSKKMRSAYIREAAVKIAARRKNHEHC